MKDRITESGVIEDQELAEYYNLMAKRYMRFLVRGSLSEYWPRELEREGPLMWVQVLVFSLSLYQRPFRRFNLKN